MDKDLQERWNKAVAMKNNFVPQPERSDWNQRCLESMKEERTKIEKRYVIKIGQTDIYCDRCGRPWGFGGHICQDVRLKQLQEREREKQEALKYQKEDLLGRLRKIGAKKMSTISFEKENGGLIPEKTINQWIYRGNIPLKYVERIEGLINSVQT